LLKKHPEIGINCLSGRDRWIHRRGNGGAKVLFGELKAGDGGVHGELDWLPIIGLLVASAEICFVIITLFKVWSGE